MDKQNFIDYIKSLGLNRKVMNLILDHIESREFDEKMVEEVATILEMAAAQSGIAAEEIDNVVGDLENLKSDLGNKFNEYEQKVDGELNNYADKVLKLAEDTAAKHGDELKQESSPVTEGVLPPSQEPMPPILQTEQVAELSSFSPVPQVSQPVVVNLPPVEQPALTIPQPAEQTYTQPGQPVQPSINPTEMPPQPPTF